ncbi:MAG TPA: 1-acyl-sn-glycerol-3-phosphate acyltransferase, partial [Smithellaceae bacterium]|nr:1-acyl-sn-glycerol-3-phosphate acyltransferase [Smithellaceae bacterium]
LYANETLADHQIDSLGLVELVVYLEDALGISIEVDKVNPLMTLEEFVRYLSSCPQHAGANLDEMILQSPITTKKTVFPNPLAELLLFIVRHLSRFFWDFQIINEDRLIPDNSIIAANHQSYLDLPWLVCRLPYRLRKRIFITGKKELSFLGYPFIGSPILFVDRQGNIVPSLKAAADVLRSGASLIIFPEGTRTNDGTLGKFKSGAAYLAYHLDKKIIPVTVRGAFEIMPRNTIIPRFFSGTKGRLIVGKAVDPRNFASVEELNDHLRSIILEQQTLPAE